MQTRSTQSFKNLLLLQVYLSVSLHFNKENFLPKQLFCFDSLDEQNIMKKSSCCLVYNVSSAELLVSACVRTLTRLSCYILTHLHFLTQPPRQKYRLGFPPSLSSSQSLEATCHSSAGRRLLVSSLLVSGSLYMTDHSVAIELKHLVCITCGSGDCPVTTHDFLLQYLFPQSDTMFLHSSIGKNRKKR